MIELRSDPYVLRSRTIQDTETEFRLNLNLRWCRGVLFNMVALKNSVAIVEYDALLWNEDSLMFVEYKDSVAAYKSLQTRRIQQVSSFAKNIARGLGYGHYTFLIVVKDLKMPTTRGGAVVIPLYQLGSYDPVFDSTVEELDYLDNLMRKYSRDGNDDVVKELEKLKTIIEAGLS